MAERSGEISEKVYNGPISPVGKLLVPISIIGSYQARFDGQAVLDTGLNRGLLVGFELAERLRLPLQNPDIVLRVGGTAEGRLSHGYVKWLGRTLFTSILVVSGEDEVYLGMELLHGARISIKAKNFYIVRP
jgi:predicted aspartyl protease